MSGLIEACPFTILLMLTTANEIKKIIHLKLKEEQYRKSWTKILSYQ